ncbi:MAG: hypothetical protein HZB36_08260 [Candidatus Omnitrophica bacterium]|nr:hypothetical protein [Candidatus Omnitrophota bacterium]
MDYNTFKKRFINFPVIQTRDILALEKDSRQVLFNQLARWRKRGLIFKLKRGVYMLNENDRKINPEKPFIANQLYAPSYVSLEYALSFYELIPEAVADVTSVTTKKTASFENKFGKFIYQHIRPCAFRGFKAAKDASGGTCLLAVPEKAVVDFIYLNLHLFKPGDRDIFEQSYRFQNLEILKLKKIKEMACLFNNHKLIKVAATFCEFARTQRAQ